MNYTEPSSEASPEPSPEFVSSRARRRRAQRRAYFPADEAVRNALFEHLARRAFPSYELFVFSLVAGVILGVGYFFNAQALLIFGILVAPLLTSWVGMSLALIAGSARLFAQTLIALFISSLLIFGSGLLAGYASRILPDASRNFNEAFNHSRLWPPDLFVLTVGAIILTISFVRSEERPYLPSALLAYELLLPLCAAGFGLGSGVGVSEIWPQGALVFLVHFAWATFFAILTLFFLRFYPISTLIPATLPAAERNPAALLPTTCEVAAIDLMGAWVTAGYPETTAFPFESTNAGYCTGTFPSDVQPLLSEANIWSAGSLACAACHGSDLAASPGRLDLETYAGIVSGSQPSEPDGKTVDILAGGNWKTSILYQTLAPGHPPGAAAGGPIIFAGTPATAPSP